MVIDKVFALLSCINIPGCLRADDKWRPDTQPVSGKTFGYLAWFDRMKGVMSLSCAVLLGMTMSMVSFSASAQVEPQWQDISSQLSISLSNPIRSRRSPDAKVIINMTNNGSDTLLPPARLIIRNLLPSSGLTIEGASTTSAGEPMLELRGYLGGGVSPGASLSPITLNVLGGGSVSFGFDVVVESQVTEAQPLLVEITAPDSLMTVGVSPLPIEGTVSDSDAVLTVNGAVVTHSGGQFSASVALDEGNNTIVARAVKGSAQITDSIIVSLDTTPPYITLESHEDGQTVYSNSVTVTGLINDIVRGTVETTQANVTVNGVAATVSNRSYAATNVALSVGNNLISILGTDQVGNVGTFSFALNYEVPQGNRIELVSGQDQSSTIGSQLTSPLVVRVVDGASQPIPDTSVVLRVVQGSGVVGVGTESQGRAVVVNTDADGQASTEFQLGARVGAANQKVRARVVGIDNEVVFNASATGQPGNKLSINSGNNQRGVVGQSLPAPLVTVVTDEGANVVAGARVRYNATVGNGHFGEEQTSQEVVTDSDGRASLSFVLGDGGGLDAQRITATLLDTSAGQLITAGFTATGFVAGEAGQTTISGIVLDNQDEPIPGVTLRIDGSSRQVLSDEQGQFIITESPVGPVHLIADGSTASVPGNFPALSYNLVAISGVDNPLSSPIYMVKLNLDNSVFVGSSDVELTLDEYPGFKLEVAANSVTFPDGSGEGFISVTPVNAATVPMAPPNGMQPQFIVTVQPTGTLFDPPARLSLPNFDGHAPGAQVDMYSFDHDLEEFVAIGLGTVSEDSSVVRSNLGVGVIKAGWHCGSQPGGQGCTHNCPVCKDCDANCNCQPKPDGELADQDICEVCVNGTPTDVGISVSALPTSVCVGETVTFQARITPQLLEGQYGAPHHGVAADTGDVSISYSGMGNAELTGTAPHAEKTMITFEPFQVLSPPGCAQEVRELLVLPRNIATGDGDNYEVIPGKLNRYTALSFAQNNCPDFGVDTTLDHPVDGCSGGIAQDPTNYGGLYVPYITGSQQYNQQSTAFGAPQGTIPHASLSATLNPLPCNNHDICYQTCGTGQNLCDQALQTDANSVCGNAYPATCPTGLTTAQCEEYVDERELCFDLSERTYDGLVGFGTFAYTQRQTQFCLCCQP